MILYSIIPAEIVFSNPDESENYKFIEIEYEGEKVIASPLTNSNYVVNRVISTSPKAFLNPKLMPGQIISAGF